MLICPLCHAGSCSKFHSDRDREYLQCRKCGLVFVPPEYHLSPYEEKMRYDLHLNDPNDQGYRDFLGRLLVPVRNRLKKGARCLDFGSGPLPVLASMFREEGFEIRIYDPFYADIPGVMNCRYDFITASEVVEHLRDPGREMRQLFGMLKPGGILGIMTEMLPEPSQFGQWHYRRDRTHVCFFSPPALRWLAAELGAEIEFCGVNVVIIRKYVTAGS